MTKNNKNLLIVGSVLFALILLYGGIKGAPNKSGSQGQVSSISGSWDISDKVKENNLTQYLKEEIDFDYSHPEIQEIASQIKSSTNTPYDAVKKTAKYVYDAIQYDSAVTVSSCYQETAGSTLEIGRSDCVGMTRLNVALLRAQGIPARSVGGCLKSTVRCSPLFAVAPGVQAKVTPLTEGDFKKRGFLHEWVEVFVPTPKNPDGEWLSLEATSGQIFSKDSCDQYIIFAYDSNQYNRCTLTDQGFWNLCSIS